MSDVGFVEIVETLYDESFTDNEEHQEEDYRYLAAELLVAQDKKITDLQTVITDAVRALNENRELRKRIEEMEKEVDCLSSSYGDNWYDGFMAAVKHERNIHECGVDELSEDDVLRMSETAESVKTKKET